MDNRISAQPPSKAFAAFSSLILRTGVIISGLIIAVGLLLFLVSGQSGYPVAGNGSNPYLTFQENSPPAQQYFPITPAQITVGVLSLKPFALIMLGLLLLIATPVLNVGLLALNYFMSKDWAFLTISLFILVVLAFSLVVGRAGG